ncbi:MAG: methyltransferase [Planctomycetes bacterium]|nr:methyltransferase [Planctomycetota bacterium]
MSSKEMTSRQRVEAALNRQPTDRVPIDFGGSRITGVASIAYRRLIESLGIEEEVHLSDIKQQLALPSLDVINRMGGDVVLLNRLGPTTGMPFLYIDRWKQGQMTDGSACLVPENYEVNVMDNGTAQVLWQGKVFAHRPAGSLYFDVCEAPLKDADTCTDIDAYVFPDAWSEREETFLKDQIQKLYYGTDKALFAGLPLMNQSFYEIGAVLFGYEQFMMNLMLKRDMVEHWLDRKLEHDLEILGKYLAIAGPYISVIQMNDDFGAQDALQIPPNLYREIFKPRQKKWVEFVKTRTNAKVFIHCDGAIEELLPDFIEIGIDILNPLQTSARGMEPEKIKKKYGKDLCFWGGGVETQTTLPFGSIEDIRREVQQRIKLLSQGGGYVFGTIHNIQADISPEKIRAVFETALTCQTESSSL